MYISDLKLCGNFALFIRWILAQAPGKSPLCPSWEFSDQLITVILGHLWTSEHLQMRARIGLLHLYLDES